MRPVIILGSGMHMGMLVGLGCEVLAMDEMPAWEPGVESPHAAERHVERVKRNTSPRSRAGKAARWK